MSTEAIDKIKKLGPAASTFGAVLLMVTIAKSQLDHLTATLSSLQRQIAEHAAWQAGNMQCYEEVRRSIEELKLEVRDQRKEQMRLHLPKGAIGP